MHKQFIKIRITRSAILLLSLKAKQQTTNEGVFEPSLQ